ncbi:FAD-dependent oxidoreductase [Pelagirhabdus alkalitolerans]|nr:FAD-dependent oxidoreductase [Pelagirhabdus alkalitolerans]
MTQYTADIAVIGGSFGGCIAAISAAKSGKTVMLTEETDWIGGQVTSQGVPPDEHQWIETTGCTDSYRLFRDHVRQYYKDHYPLTDEATANPALNPGKAWVSRISHEPKVALKVLESMMAPYINSGKLTIFYHTKPESLSKAEGKITSLDLINIENHESLTIQANYFLDATDTGELLPLAGVAYHSGAESYDDTHEKHAPEVADPNDTQAFTYVIPIDYVEGENDTIDRPEQYDFWKNYIPKNHTHSLLSWFVGNKSDPTPQKQFTLFENDQSIPDLFSYRRVMATSILANPIYDGDVSLINWPQNDYFLGSIIDVDKRTYSEHIENAKQLSLSLVYWLQTEAERLDGGFGYPGIRLRKDVFDTEDGLAKYPYIRESRRIKAACMITEDMVSKETGNVDGIYHHEDTVGIGCYHLDLHTTATSMSALYVPSYPYEIPLGAFIQEELSNLLPACKNIGTTHITNGCYRLHPTEWNIGEVAGYLAAYSMQHGYTPLEIYQNKDTLKNFQRYLVEQGVQIRWPEYVEKEVHDPIK